MKPSTIVLGLAGVLIGFGLLSVTGVLPAWTEALTVGASMTGLVFMALGLGLARRERRGR